MASKALEKRVLRVIKTLDAAYYALENMIEADTESYSSNDSRFVIKKSIREYGEYLEDATWWKK